MGNVTWRAPCKYFCCGDAISFIYSEFVCVVSVIKHVKHMRSVTSSLVALSVVQNFSVFSHKRYHFRKDLSIIKCVLRSSLPIYPEHFSFSKEMSVT